MLVSCPSCGKRISDRAPTCPFCRASARPSDPPPVANVDSALAPSREVSMPEPAPARAEAPPPAAPPQAALQVPEALPAYERGDFIGDLFQVIQTLEALASHDRALAIDPRFSIGKFHKGRLEAALGRRDAAILAFQQFLALAPPNLAALSNEARKRLQELKA